MKKIVYSFTIILSCIILFIIFTTGKYENINNKNEAKHKTEIITPDYITNNKLDEVTATIYVSDIESGSIVDKTVKVKELTYEAIFEELKNEKIIVSDTTLNSFTTYENQENELVGVLNLSKEFYNFNLGSGFESMMLDSIAKTYIENFNLDKFKILIDDKEYESGHILFEENDYFTKDSIE